MRNEKQSSVVRAPVLLGNQQQPLGVTIQHFPDIAAKSVGIGEANRMVFARPYAILSNQEPGIVFDRSSEVVPPGMVYTEPNVNTGARDGGSTGSYRDDRGVADRSMAGRLRRLFK